MDSVLMQIKPYVLSAFAAAALALPTAAAADTAPPATPAAQPAGSSEAVTVSRYLMGRVKPTMRARGAAHLWTNTGFSNRRAVYPVIKHQLLKDGSEWLQVRALRNRTQVK